MRVLLNATASELTFIGGDFSQYKALMQLGSYAPGWEFCLLEHTSAGYRAKVRQLEALAVRMPFVGLKRWLFAQARQVPILAKDLDEQRPDVVYSIVLAARLPRQHRVPQVWWSQGISPAAYYDYWGRFSIQDVAALYRHVAPRVDLIVSATHDCARRLTELCGHLPCPVVVVPEVTLVPSLHDLEAKGGGDRIRLLFVGQDYRRKGLVELLPSYQRLKRHYTNLELHIVTVRDCPLRATYAHLSDVYWHANLSNAELDTLLERAHILVVPTHADTFNRIMVEGMAKGCVIVSTDLPPLGEVAPHNEVGLLVPRGDVDALTEAIERLAQDAELRRRFAQASLNRYKSVYAPEVVVPQLLAAVEQAATLR